VSAPLVVNPIDR